MQPEATSYRQKGRKGNFPTNSTRKAGPKGKEEARLAHLRGTMPILIKVK